jgi:hypothetical protein
MKMPLQQHANSPEPVRAQVISNPFSENASHNVAAPQTSPVEQNSPNITAVDQAATPPSASDNDLIEKVWVEAVKQLSKDHGDDPFVLQQKQAELTRDYLKKRFSREIKAS